jgi:hypothetical protein
MTNYISQTTKTNVFIETNILKFLQDIDLDYDKVIDYLAYECGISNKKAKERLDLFIKMGKIKKDNNTLTVPDKELDNYIKSLKTREKEIDKVFDTLETQK